MKESAKEPTSLFHDFMAQQHANVFMRAFSFAANQLPQTSEKHPEIADRVLIVDDMGFIFHIREREAKVAAKSADLSDESRAHVTCSRATSDFPSSIISATA